MRRKRWDGKAETFWPILEPNGECLEFPTRGGEGYGVVGWGSKLWRAHRVAWKLKHGRLPRGLMVMHRCDNPPCCNPDHLFLGTAKENMDDKCAKRRWSGGRIPPGGVGRGTLALRLFKHREYLGQNISGFANLLGISQRQLWDLRHGRYEYLWL